MSSRERVRSGSPAHSRDRDIDRRHSPHSRHHRDSPRNSRSSRDRSPGRPFNNRHSHQRQHHNNTPPGSSQQSHTDIPADIAAVTVFVSDIHPRVSEKDLFEFFSHVGQVNDVRLIRDSATGKSKGHCYIEFDTADQADTAVAMNEQELGGYPITVKPVQITSAHQPARKVASDTNSELVGPDYPMQLYVGSLQYNIAVDDVKPVFEAFGPVDHMMIHMDEKTKLTKGFGFVTYRYARDAKIALQALNGIEVAGRPIKVGLSSHSQKQAVALGLLTNGQTVDQFNSAQGIGNSKVDSNKRTDGNSAGGDVGFVPPMHHTAPVDSNAQRLEDESGIRLDNTSRASLMQKLAERGNPQQQHTNGHAAAAPAQQPIAYQTTVVSASNDVVRQQATTCVVLQNMFDPADELAQAGENWAVDIRTDTVGECSKYGTVQHCYVDQYSPAGIVYMRMSSVNEAMAVTHALSGRYFAGKQITANYISEQMYTLKFPDQR